MNTGNRIADFKYLPNSDYDKQIKINGEQIGVFSPKAMKQMYPKGFFRLLGETFEGSKRDRDRDIARLDIADKRMYVTKVGTHSKIFRQKSSYVELESGGYIALLKPRIAAFILIAAILIAIIGGVTLITSGVSFGGDTSYDPNIKPIDVEYFVVSGTVSRGDTMMPDSTITLQNADMVTTTTTDADGKFTFNYVKNGDYNIICNCGDSILTQMITVSNGAVTTKFDFPAKETTVVKSTIEYYGEDTPMIIVGGLDKEALQQAEDEKEVSITFKARQLAINEVPSDALAAITRISGDLSLTYYDFTVSKSVKPADNTDSVNLTSTENVLEIMVPYDSTTAVGTYVLRFHDGTATRLTEIKQMPTDNYQDGTYYVAPTKVYIYSSLYSTYAIGYANAGHVTKGNDTITYNNEAILTLSTGNIDMLYEHGADATLNSKVRLYLETETGNVLISESGIIPPGSKIEQMTLKSDITGLPTQGSYSAFMQIIYLGDGNTVTNTNINIPITVKIKK